MLQPFEPLPLATTPSESRSNIPISMATLHADSNDPPEYMTIETPHSSPELNQSNLLYHDDQLDQSNISRIKTSEWLKQVSINANQSDQLSLSRSDSAKKSRRKKFVPGGLAEQLQQILQRENSEITYWEHSLAKTQQDSQQGMYADIKKYGRSGNFCVNKLSYDKFFMYKSFRRNKPLPH